MGTTNLDSAPPYSGRSDVSFTSVEEARRGAGPEGQAAPAGTTAVAVERGDTLSGLMSQANPPLDWNNPEQRAQFLSDNPQFSDVGGGRNPDLIWPGEVVYIRTGSAEGTGEPTPPEVGGEPPTNGAQAVSGPDAEGNYAYQNYVNGQPSGDQYTAQPGGSGQPANAVIIADNGGEIRTDAQGAPMTGWGQVGETTGAGDSAYVYYVNGMPTTESQVRTTADGPPTEPPAPQTGEDGVGASYATDGWHVTASSSQGVALHYYVGGYQVATDQVVNGRSDGPPPIIPPGTNDRLATNEFDGTVSETVGTPDGTYQTVTRTYVDGVLTNTERGPEFE